MRMSDNERNAPRWGSDPQSDEFGPQGDALILELQRLRRAIDAEKNEIRASRHKPRAKTKLDPRRHQAAKRKRKSKSKSRVRQAIAVCLQQFGLKSPLEFELLQEPAPPPRVPTYRPPREPAPPAREPASPPRETAPPPRRPSPTLAPRDPLTMDLTSLAPASPNRIAADPAADADVRHRALLPVANGTAIQQLVASCRSGFTAGAKFVVSASGTAPPAESSLLTGTAWSYERELRIGLRILLITGVLGGGWFFLMPLAGAVV